MGEAKRARYIEAMNILSIQSEVVFGHVGNSAARFALNRLGHTVWAVPSVLLSAHAGYPNVQGRISEVGEMAALIDGLAANGWLDTCDGVLSGYLGAADQAALVGETVSRIKRANPRALYCLDPVFGDDGRAYAKAGVAEAMARVLLPLADIVTPNAFELSSLTSIAVRGVDDALEGARRLGRPCVLATSVPDAGRIGVLLYEKGEAWFAATEYFADAPHGAGDLLAALFAGHVLAGVAGPQALARAVAAVFAVIAQSVTENSPELALVAAQGALAGDDWQSTVALRKIG